MTEYRMLATDLDDSLLNDRYEITPVDREAIARAVSAGVRVVLATGRMFRSALPYALDLGLDTPLVTYQGAFVKFPDNGKVLYNRPVPLEIALDLVETVTAAGFHTNIYIDDNLLVEKLTEESRIYQEISGIEPVVVGDLARYLREERRDPTKILMVSSRDKIDRLWGELGNYFGEKLYITKSKPIFLECMHPESTKGRALKAVAGYYGISPADIIVVGDSYNDLEMIRYAGLGVAVANAREEVKKSAGFVTLSNNDGGVARVIRKFIFHEED
ncbi:MAG: Cof-type HAD-IIB family hydrolase [Bacillota bacterium]